MIGKEALIDSLKRLKQSYGVISIKAEFEAEGSRKDELIMLRDFVYQADLGFIIKIVNVKQIFISLGNVFFTLYGKQFFTSYGKEIFIL